MFDVGGISVDQMGRIGIVHVAGTRVYLSWRYPLNERLCILIGDRTIRDPTSRLPGPAISIKGQLPDQARQHIWHGLQCILNYLVEPIKANSWPWCEYGVVKGHNYEKV